MNNILNHAENDRESIPVTPQTNNDSQINKEPLTTTPYTIPHSELKAMVIHSAAELMPKIPEKESKLLLEDIKLNGQREPVIMHQGKLLDGRNRLWACLELGVDVKAVNLEGEINPEEYVKSLNLKRRHLRPAQLATIAANDMEHRQPPAKGKLRDIVAKEYGISPRMVQSAKTLKEKRPDLFEKAFSGEKKNLSIPAEGKPKKVSLPEPEFINKLLALIPVEMKSQLDQFREELSGDQQKAVNARIYELRQQTLKATIAGFRPSPVSSDSGA